MISRYSNKEMALIWSKESRFNFMLQVEKEVALVQASLGIIPKSAGQAIQRSKFNLSKIESIEVQTKHDVVAFVMVLESSIKKYGEFIHYGLTSSDVLDTALSLQVVEAFKFLTKGFTKLETALGSLIKVHRDTVCVGRTHGMHADLTTFGLKMAGHLAELQRNRSRVIRAIDQFKVCKLSGTVGAYNLLSNVVEKKVASKLGLKPEMVATQVIPRDRHAEVILSLAQYQTGIERLATEFRHLQRTEVGEVSEGFSKGQHGSSAMPHKKNPISSENLCGISRLVRGYVAPLMENITLWHERDISHSSVERVIFPDMFIVLDYAVHRMADVIKNLKIDKTRMKKNLEGSKHKILSSKLLLNLIDQKMSRKNAYALVQEYSFGMSKKVKHLDEIDFEKYKKQIRFTSNKVIKKLGL